MPELSQQIYLWLSNKLSCITSTNSELEIGITDVDNFKLNLFV